jgi:DNA-binding transcriptional MerR regulator
MRSASHKSSEAFRTISEVSYELDVPQHVLRFWESKFGAIRPLKRGGGRRYYRPNDVDLLRGIRSLLYSDGLTIRGVKKLLRQRGARYVTELGCDSVSHLETVHADTERSDQEDFETASNVRPFPQASATRPADTESDGLTGSERAYFSSLIVELEDLKDRLRTARRNITQI